MISPLFIKAFLLKIVENFNIGKNTFFSATTLVQYGSIFSSPPFAFSVEIASLNRSSSLTVLHRKRPLEYIRYHGKRVRSGDLPFFRDMRNRAEFHEMRNGRAFKHEAKAGRGIETEGWVKVME